jgi:hypothetical protein
MQGLEINEIQALLVSELIADIPNDKLKDFLVFRMRFIDQYKSKELITKEALYEYQKIKVQHRLRAGENVFETVEQVQEYVEAHFKGKEIGYGLGAYKEFVVIAMDRDCNLLNTYYAPNGNFYKLTSVEKEKVYKFLFENQHRIGDVKRIPYYDDTKQIEAPKKEDDKSYIAPKVLELMNGTVKKINKEQIK